MARRSGTVAQKGRELKAGSFAATSNSRRRGLELTDEVVVVHDVEDERPHSYSECVEAVWIRRWPKTGCVHVAGVDELAKPIRAVAAPQESCGGTVRIDFHRDGVVRPAGAASLPDFIERTLMQVVKFDVGRDLNRVFKLMSEEASEPLRSPSHPDH